MCKYFQLLCKRHIILVILVLYQAQTTLTSTNREVSVFRGVSTEKVLYYMPGMCKGRSWVTPLENIEYLLRKLVLVISMCCEWKITLDKLCSVNGTNVFRVV